VVGKDHRVFFPETVPPLCIAFRTPWGPLSLEVALDTRGAKLVGEEMTQLQSATVLAGSA
jgi:hypothetical protein